MYERQYEEQIELSKAIASTVYIYPFDTVGGWIEI